MRSEVAELPWGFRMRWRLWALWVVTLLLVGSARLSLPQRHTHTHTHTHTLTHTPTHTNQQTTQTHTHTHTLTHFTHTHTHPPTPPPPPPPYIHHIFPKSRADGYLRV